MQPEGFTIKKTLLVVLPSMQNGAVVVMNRSNMYLYSSELRFTAAFVLAIAVGSVTHSSPGPVQHPTSHRGQHHRQQWT